MHLRLLLCTALVLISVSTSVARAGSMDLVLDVVGRLDPFTFDPLPVTRNGNWITSGPGLYLFQVAFTAERGPGEKGWAGTSFDVSKTPGLVAINESYLPTFDTLDTNGAAPGGVLPVYGVNQDLPPLDLKDIVASIISPTIPNTNPAEKRNQLGTPNAPASVLIPGSPPLTHIGDFALQWNGAGLQQVWLTDHSFFFTLENGTPTTYLDDTFGPSVAGAGSNFFNFGSPLSITPLIFPKPPMTDVRAGDIINTTFTAVDANVTLVPSTWSLVGDGLHSFQPLFPGAQIPDFNGSIDPRTGEFTWDTTGFAPGTYDIAIQITNTAGIASMPSHFLVVITVPEPSTLALGSFAILGSLGIIARRR